MILHHYRLVIGNDSDFEGLILPTRATTLRGARIALGLAMAKAKGDVWGKVEVRLPDGQWVQWGAHPAAQAAIADSISKGQVALAQIESAVDNAVRGAGAEAPALERRDKGR